MKSKLEKANPRTPKSTIDTPSQPLKRLRGGCHRIDSNAERSKVESSDIRVLRDGKDALDLRRVIRRYRVQADGSPRHVARCRAQIRAEEQVRRAVVPETNVDTPDVEHLVRKHSLGIDEEWLDNRIKDVGEGGSRAFDGRFIARYCGILEGHRSWRGVSVCPKRKMSSGHTCRAMGERGQSHSNPHLTRWGYAPVTVLQAKKKKSVHEI